MHRRKMYLNIQKYTWPVKAIDSYFVSRDVGIVESIIYIVKTILIYFTYLNINKYRSVLLKIFNQPATNMQSFPLNSSPMSGDQMPSLPGRKRRQMPGVCQGGMLKLRFDCYITNLQKKRITLFDLHVA